uniref:Uncharacterized protein n=1 Tax=Panagrolaimus sp. ES5 TaxID=591445 RepID=A0AC34FDI7_9BILA
MSQSRLARNKNSNFGKYNDLMKIHQMVQQSLASLNIKNYSIRNVQDAPTSVPTIPGGLTKMDPFKSILLKVL